jgi:hypothetical protein
MYVMSRSRSYLRRFLDWTFELDRRKLHAQHGTGSFNPHAVFQSESPERGRANRTVRYCKRLISLAPDVKVKLASRPARSIGIEYITYRPLQYLQDRSGRLSILDHNITTSDHSPSPVDWRFPSPSLVWVLKQDDNPTSQDPIGATRTSLAAR